MEGAAPGMCPGRAQARGWRWREPPSCGLARRMGSSRNGSDPVTRGEGRGPSLSESEEGTLTTSLPLHPSLHSPLPALHTPVTLRCQGDPSVELSLHISESCVLLQDHVGWVLILKSMNF